MASPCPPTMVPPFAFGSRASLAIRTPNISQKSLLRTTWTFTARALALGTAAFDSAGSFGRGHPLQLPTELTNENLSQRLRLAVVQPGDVVDAPGILDLGQIERDR